MDLKDFAKKSPGSKIKIGDRLYVKLSEPVIKANVDFFDFIEDEYKIYNAVDLKTGKLVKLI